MCIVYIDINSTLTTHDIYTQRQPVKEYHRIKFTRFRVSGHTLAVETAWALEQARAGPLTAGRAAVQLW